MELFEAIRREYQFGVGTIKGVARKLGIHRRMVREALADAVPKERKIVERVRPKLEPAIAFIDTILETDLNAPRKQRHTARRIFNRLRIEKPSIEVAEATVRAYVREKKRRSPDGSGRSSVSFPARTHAPSLPLPRLTASQSAAG